MSLSKKYFIYYCRLSIIEGLNTDLPTSKLILGHYNKEIYRECSHCKCVIEIAKAFTENEFICNMCLKQKKNDETSPKTYIIWKGNLKFRVF